MHLWKLKQEHRMHEYAEHGHAAHWLCKEGDNKLPTSGGILSSKLQASACLHGDVDNQNTVRDDSYHKYNFLKAGHPVLRVDESHLLAAIVISKTLFLSATHQSVALVLLSDRISLTSDVGKDSTCENPDPSRQMGLEAVQPQNPAAETTENVEALLEAARYDDIEDIVSLSSAGVSLDSKDSQGRTALHMAAANGHIQIVEHLISRGVDVNASNVEKNTPLHWACLNGHVEIVKKLIMSGASVTALNSHDRTPMDEAISLGKLDIMDSINTAVAQLELTGVSVS